MGLRVEAATSTRNRNQGPTDATCTRHKIKPESLLFLAGQGIPQRFIDFARNRKCYDGACEATSPHPPPVSISIVNVTRSSQLSMARANIQIDSNSLNESESSTRSIRFGLLHLPFPFSQTSGSAKSKYPYFQPSHREHTRGSSSSLHISGLSRGAQEARLSTLREQGEASLPSRC